MIAVFARPDDPEHPVARATWIGPRVDVEADDEEVRQAVERIFRPVPVVVDDPSLRTAGTSGSVQLPPGSLNWFLAAARSRAEAGGFKVSFVPGGQGTTGWDPAGTYRTFLHQVERLERHQQSS